MILVAVAFSLKGTAGQPPTWSRIVVTAFAAVMAAVILQIGFRTPAIAPATPAEEARITPSRRG